MMEIFSLFLYQNESQSKTCYSFSYMLHYFHVDVLV